MSKEFTPLEALNYLRNKLIRNNITFRSCMFEIIEKELINCEHLQDIIDTYEQNYGIYPESEDFKKGQKKLKALEIIKEEPIVALVDYKYTYEEWLEIVDEREKDLFKSKEEYELLKEVLL